MIGFAIAAGAAVLGSVIQSSAAKSAAETQASAIKNASRISSAAATQARADVMDTYTPALADYGRAIEELQPQVASGTADIINTLVNASNATQQLLAQSGADARKAILGSTASASGIPRQGFDSRYAQLSSLPPDQQAQAFTQMAQNIDQRYAQTTGQTDMPTKRGGASTTQAIQAISNTPDAFPISAARQPTTPGTGFYGAIEALDQGTTGSLSALAGGTAAARGDIATGKSEALSSLGTARTEALGALAPYTEAGSQAAQREAALSGALGPEAQQEAINAFIESPGQKYLREREEQSLLRNASAIGGLGGGRVRTALQEQAMGIAATQQQNYLENLRSIASRGMEAGTSTANVWTQTGAQEAQIQQTAAAQLASLAQALGVQSADLINMNAQQRSALAMQVGANLAQLDQAIAAAKVGALSSYTQSITGTQAGGLADVVRLAETNATTQLAGKQQLGTTLANIGVGQGTQQAALAAAQGSALATGTWLSGQSLAQGVNNLGTLAAKAFSGTTAPGTTASSPSSLNTSLNMPSFDNLSLLNTGQKMSI